MSGIRVVRASAGSGKTYMLAYEYVKNVVVDPFSYRHILAVTFTNKATEEMKQRIVDEIHILASGKQSSYMADLSQETQMGEANIRVQARRAQSLILHDYSHFAVLTIDKFFQRIIRSFIKELGVDLNFNLELQTDSLLASAAQEVIDDTATNAELKQWIIAFIEERIDENRHWDIKHELISLGKEIFKEEFKRAQMGETSKQRLLAIVRQADKRAADIIESRQGIAQQALDIIEGAGLGIEDFAYGKNGFASYFAKSARGEFESYTKRAAEALEVDQKWCSKSSPLREDIRSLVPHLRPLLETLCRGYDSDVAHVNSAALLRRNYRNFALLTDLSAKIGKLCSEGNIMPISETNHILRELIAGNDTPFIFEKVGTHFTHFMIDEFQDTSTMQWDNFVPLLENAISQSEQSPVLLVGDVKQSIYRWRGGDWQILAKGVGAIFDGVENRSLDTNYRSSSRVVEFNNALVQSCVSLDSARLDSELQTAHTTELINQPTLDQLSGMLESAYTGHAQKPKNSEPRGYVKIVQYAKPEDADTVVPPVIAHIEELQSRGYAPGDIAILVRYKKEGVAVAQMLLDHKSENPDSPYSYDVVTAEALRIGDSPVTIFAGACLHLAANADNTIKRAVYNHSLARPVDSAIPPEELSVFATLRRKSPEEAFEQILMQWHIGDKPADVAYVQAMHEQVISFCSNNIADIPLFLRWWDETGASQSINMPKSSSAITIITIHKAKGLEYPAVIIPYCDWRLPPKPNSIIWSDTAGSPMQELGRVPVGSASMMGSSYFAHDYYRELVLSHIDNVNTFYVATTRAREEICLMMPLPKKKADPDKLAAKISTLVDQSLVVVDGEVRLGAMVGVVTQDEDSLTFEFGEPSIAVDSKPRATTAPSRYPTRSGGAKIRLRQRMQRYTDDDPDANPALSPRNYGILMHKLFESAHSIEDLRTAMMSMRLSGAISGEEEASLKKLANEAMSNHTINSWFSGSWDAIKTESEIIIPHQSAIKRPDRVMIRGTQAVVVDYKFGAKQSTQHTTQLREYMLLLTQMGYTDVQGYIWYVSTNTVERVQG